MGGISKECIETQRRKRTVQADKSHRPGTEV